MMFHTLEKFVQKYQKEQASKENEQEEDFDIPLDQVVDLELDPTELLPALVVTSHEPLWIKLSESLDMPLEQVEDTAMRVISQLVLNSSNSDPSDHTILKQQFRQFHHAYLWNDRGSHHFFSLILNEVCSSKPLEQQDIEELLDILYENYKVLQNGLYEQHSFFHPRDIPLPENKNTLKTRLMRKRIMEGKVLFRDVMDTLRDMAPRKTSTQPTKIRSPPTSPTKKKKRGNFQKIKKALRKTQQSAAQRECDKLFQSLDKDKDKRLCLKEVGDFVTSHPNLWAMLSVNLNLAEDSCQRIATRVTLELASNTTSRNSELDSKHFYKFYTRFVKDPQGNQEFFHRCVFAAFDQDGDALLNAQELDNLLEVFYQEGSIFAGDARLPETRDKLRQQITTGEDHHLSFEDVRGLISGHGVPA